MRDGIFSTIKIEPDSSGSSVVKPYRKLAARHAISDRFREEKRLGGGRRARLSKRGASPRVYRRHAARPLPALLTHFLSLNISGVDYE